jgi:hypothetical protein
MPFSEDDGAALMSDAENLRRQVAALKTELVSEHAKTLAATHLGDADYAPVFADALAVTVSDDGRASVGVVTKNGKPKMTWDSERKRLTPVGDGDLVASTKERFPQLPWRRSTTDDSKPTPPTKESDAELMARLRAEHSAKAMPALTVSEIAAARQRNPFAKETANLTWQMKILRHDPKLAGQLQAEAGAVA